ncbi:PREDICTED: SAC3 family protein A-like isoform X1 [Ipomoea nil]|uniref:SAC3 family protein A-like isoform X1 n=1 Tax=Ipomoea nil TaxID=35883 RepID=UPI0009018B35|nr:PREDICTED: SAC3 family protein A-like isoform X1 [Ipomoea nil]XP_019192323.1 PREDICTED: SAC3 family protein A-like isoform X1 [Ipomoea nil]
MMNQGPKAADAAPTFMPNLQENHQIVDASQHYASSYYAPPTSVAASWTAHGVDNYARENGVISNPGYHHDQQANTTSTNIQDGSSVASTSAASSSVAAGVPQDYSNYSTYPSTNPYGYNNAGYAAYYNGYHQQSNQSYAQPVGAYQNTGAPYQPLSSFQNTGSYAGTASYSSTYYNPGNYQTAGGYPSGYSNQYDQYATYPSQQYHTYSSDSAAAYGSTTTVPASQHQQQYNQWANYYTPPQTEVTCAPGTENLSVSNSSSLSCPIPGVSGGYTAANSQPPAPHAPSWKPESTTSELPTVQSTVVSGNAHDSYWNHWAPAFQNQQSSSVQHHVQNPSDVAPTYESIQNQPKTPGPPGPNFQYPTSHQMPSSYQTPMQNIHQTVPQTVPPEETHRVSKLQIPTNPRITSTLGVGLLKTDKDSSATTAAEKPAYVSVSLPKQNEKVSSEGSDSILKHGAFPKSLRGYVERALARCKDDSEMASCQAVMKEIISKATADGTLFTKDWDTEPLFPLSNSDGVNKEGLFFSTSTPNSKCKRSPSRRFKSRWEPVPEEKPIDKQESVTPNAIKYGSWNKQDYFLQFSNEKTESKMHRLGNVKFSLSEQKVSSTDTLRAAKRQRLGENLNAADNGEASSDSDKEESLTAYYSTAITLADSPEERKRRESRSKRFEKGHGNKAKNNHIKTKSVGAGNLYSRRATALWLSRSSEESGSKAVEDIDWDALTVKGTCQEIEKRYLRLTSAPDPATVRPEEVLEKALLMVQNSPKNYLYKCDQLKSIRQDLTVQHIHNGLTVRVYETHARLAIEAGDLAEYNQCQSQLKTLYSEGISGCNMEFAAYNLLCALLHSNNKRDLLSAMSRLSSEARENSAVKHALSVRMAVASGNYVLFFRLYRTAPNLNTCLMDLFVEKMRYAAVRCMSRSYRPTVPVPYIAQVLGFASIYPTTDASDAKETDGVEECLEWLKAHGACLSSDNSGEMLLDAKTSASTLFMPEPEDAVSHGDASLAVNDFLTRNLA